MASFFQDLYKDKQSVGIEIIFQPDNTKVYNFILLKKDKGALFIENSKEKITSIEDLKNRIPKNVPISLVLNGKGILHKTISVNEKDTEITLLQKVLPNAQIDDFYIQKIHLDDKIIASLIRKDQFQLAYDEILFLSTQIVFVSSGPFIASTLLSLLVTDQEENTIIDFLTYQLEYQNQLLVNYNLSSEKIEKEYNFSGNKVNSSLILSFSAALSVFLPNQTDIKNNINSVEINNEEFYQKKVFKLRLGSMLAVLFLLMIINFMLFSSFFSKKNTLSTQMSLVQNQLQQHDTLLKEVQQKKEFLSNAGLLENSRLSYYLDQMAIDLSPSITLIELNVNPIIKNVTPNGDILNSTNKLIKVKGLCTQTVVLNEWIKKLEKKKWIKNVHMVNYSQLKSSDPGEFIFEIYLL